MSPGVVSGVAAARLARRCCGRVFSGLREYATSLTALRPGIRVTLVPLWVVYIASGEWRDGGATPVHEVNSARRGGA